VARVGHVEAKDIHSQIHELFERGPCAGGGAESGNDFSAAHKGSPVTLKELPL